LPNSLARIWNNSACRNVCLAVRKWDILDKLFFFYERSFRSAGMFLIYMHNHAHTCLFMRIYTGACIHTHTHRNWHALVYTDMHEHADMHNTSWMIYNIYIYTHIVQ
jgi:hypothetical protein